MQDEQLDREGHPEAHPAQPGAPAPRTAPGKPSGGSTWPAVLGVIALVFGAAGMLNNLIGALSPFLLEAFTSALAGEIGGEAEETVHMTMEITRAWRGWTVGLGLVGVVVSGLLLIGGIQLLMRRAASVQLLKTWAMVRMLMVVVAAGIGWRVQQQTFEALRGAMGAEMDQVPAGLLGATAMFGTVFSLLFGWALPLFFLFWFARQAIKDEVEGWM
jgi:hypothetical protein